MAYRIFRHPGKPSLNRNGTQMFLFFKEIRLIEASKRIKSLSFGVSHLLMNESSHHWESFMGICSTNGSYGCCPLGGMIRINYTKVWYINSLRPSNAYMHKKNHWLNNGCLWLALHQAIIWTNANLLSIQPWRTNLSGILIGISVGHFVLASICFKTYCIQHMPLAEDRLDIELIKDTS